MDNVYKSLVGKLCKVGCPLIKLQRPLVVVDCSHTVIQNLLEQLPPENKITVLRVWDWDYLKQED